MKNASASVNVAKQARQFVRQQFAARVVRIDGEFQSKVLKDGAKVQIRNPNTVLANLREVCGRPVSEEGNTTTFKMKKVGMIALTVGSTNTLRLINAH